MRSIIGAVRAVIRITGREGPGERIFFYTVFIKNVDFGVKRH